MPVLRATAAPLVRPLLILTAIFVISLPLVTARLYASDEVQYYAWLRSLWFDRDVSFENEYQHFYDSGVVHYPGFHETFLERQTETGRRITFATMGSAVLWSPFYAVADVVVRIRQARGEAIVADGYAQPYIAAVAYGSAVYGWLSLLLSFLIVRRVLGRGAPHALDGTHAAATTREARRQEADEEGDGALVERIGLGAVVALWIGTPLFFYMYIAPPMSHACSAFAVALFVWVWLHVRTQWSLGGMLLLGGLAALMAMVREQDLFVAIGPAVDWAWMWISPRLRRRDDPPVARGQLLINAAAGAVTFIIVYTPQLMAYVALNGYPGPSRLVARKMNWVAPYALGVLASPEHGLLFWTPLVLLSLAGLAWLAWRGGAGGWADEDARRIGVCALVIVASQVYVAGSVESWTVAGAFGQRRFIGLSSIFALGLAACWLRAASMQWTRWAVTALVALGIWWNLGLMAQFGAGLMDRQRLELGRNAQNTFITIPLRLPELVHRYVFERGTFYKKAD